MVKETIPNCSHDSHLQLQIDPEVGCIATKACWQYGIKEEPPLVLLFSEAQVYAVKIDCPPKFPFSAHICNNFSLDDLSKSQEFFQYLYFHVWHNHDQETVFCVSLGKFEAWKEECHILLGMGHNDVI
jgi:hypothetical protein